MFCVEVEEIKRSLSAVRLNVEQMRHYLFQFTASMAAVLYSTLIKKENQIFLIYKEIQMGAVAESYMTNGLLPYMVKHLRISSYIRKPFLVYDFATEFPHK
jgi:hypothetical protein